MKQCMDQPAGPKTRCTELLPLLGNHYCDRHGKERLAESRNYERVSFQRLTTVTLQIVELQMQLESLVKEDRYLRNKVMNERKEIEAYAERYEAQSKETE